MSVPSCAKREPWQEQSHVCSQGFHFNAQPMWGQRGTDGVRSPAREAPTFLISCMDHILREGENTSAYLFSLPAMMPVRI